MFAIIVYCYFTFDLIRGKKIIRSHDVTIIKEFINSAAVVVFPKL